MRNLVNVGHLEVDLGLPPDVGQVRFTAEDDENGVIYVVGSGLAIACLSAATLETRWTADIGALAPAAGCDLPPDAAPTAAAFSPDLAALTLGLSSGHLLLLHPPTAPGAGTPALEEVGVLEGGVAAAGWSPDGDAFAVLSGAGQLLLMTPEWEVLWEAPVADNSPAFPQPDAVPGPLPPTGGDAPTLSPANAALSWRGDGKYVATCTVDVEPLNGSTQPARVRVWDRESGGLHALGVAAAGLRAVAAWQPNGRHLYVAQHNSIGVGSTEEAEVTLQIGNGGAAAGTAERGAQGQAPEVRHVGAWKRELRRREAAAAAAGVAPSANHVLLFERNGLQHGGFDIRAPALGGTDEHGNAQCVEYMAWSPDSAVLAVVLGPEHSSEAGSGAPAPAPAHRTLQLWHRSNWHWYLKYERRYANCAGLVAAWGSSAAGGLTLRVLTARGAAIAYNFVWTPCTSALGTVAVIDGAAVLLTPLREGIVPPPLCAAAVALPAPPAALALRQRAADEREALAAVLSDNTVAVVESVEEDLWEESLEEQEERSQGWAGRGPPRLLPRLLALPEGYTHRLVRQAAWVSDSSLLLVLAGEASSPSADGGGGGGGGGGGEDDLLEIDLSDALDLSEDSIESLSTLVGTAREVCCLPAPGRVVALEAVAPGWPTGGAAVQLDSGEVWGYHPGGSLESLTPGAAFPVACPRMAALPPLPAGETPTSALSSFFAPLGLSPKGELWWGGRQIATGVTSFVLRHRGPGGPFLLYTTRAHTLRTIPLSTVFDASLPSAPSGAHEYAIPELKLQAAAAARRRGAVAETNVTVREIEEGSLLVACPADSIDAVYQAPRGNLETARPRALALPAVAAALDATDFVAAWRLATVNRLDLNVLVDYRWPRFLGQARAFLEGIASDVDAADFVAGLSPTSVTAPGGLYTAAFTALHVPIDPLNVENGNAEEEKVPAVCAAVHAAVEALRADGGAGSTPAAWLRTEVTTHSRCGDLPIALRRIKAVREAELESENLSTSASTGAASSTINISNPKTSATAEQGLRHLLLYRTEEEVYRAALGAYELELSYMVVTHSQRDPGEYLMQLQRFAAIGDPALRRHAIDAHLGRWPSALRALVDAGDAHFDAALALAREKGLLRLLLKLVGPENAEQRAAVHAAAGEDLEVRGKHEDAALAFVAAGDLEKAIRAYRLAGAWRQALGLAARLGRDAARLSALAARLASDLADSHRHAEAASVTLEYLNDVPEGVRLLAEGGEWAEASRVAWAQGRGDLLEAIIAPAAAVAAARVLENAQEDVERVRKYLTRLRELRGKRAAVAAAVAEAESLAGLAPRDDDLETEAASLVSGMSAYTDATAAGSTALSSASATTVGGRRAGGGKKKKVKSGKSSGRIRQGSPEEEAQLGRHLLSLAPLPSTCADAGQLTETLVALGHEDDAATLQRTLKTLIDEQRAAVADLVAHPPPGLALVPGPGAVERAAAIGGGAGVAALEAAAADVPGGELARRAAEGEAAAKSGAWKWEVLRAPEDEEDNGDNKGK